MNTYTIVVPEQFKSGHFNVAEVYLWILDELRKIHPELNSEGDIMWLEFIDTYEHWEAAYDNLLGVIFEDDLALSFRARALIVVFLKYFVLGKVDLNSFSIKGPVWLFGEYQLSDVANFFELDSLALSCGTFNSLRGDSQNFVIRMLESVSAMCTALQNVSFAQKLAGRINNFVIDSQCCDTPVFPERCIGYLEAIYPVCVTSRVQDIDKVFDAIFCSWWMTERGVLYNGGVLQEILTSFMAHGSAEVYYPIVKRYFERYDNARERMHSEVLNPCLSADTHLRFFLNIPDKQLQQEVFSLYLLKLCSCNFLYLQFTGKQFAQTRSAFIRYLISSQAIIVKESLLKALYKEYGNKGSTRFDQWYKKQKEQGIAFERLERQRITQEHTEKVTILHRAEQGQLIIGAALQKARRLCIKE